MRRSTAALSLINLVHSLKNSSHRKPMKMVCEETGLGDAMFCQNLLQSKMNNGYSKWLNSL